MEGNYWSSVKFAIVLVVLGGIGFASASVLAARIKEQTRVGGAQFSTNLEADLARVADPAHGLPEEKKRESFRMFRRIVAEWKPFAAELAPFFLALRGEGFPKSPVGFEIAFSFSQFVSATGAHSVEIGQGLDQSLRVSLRGYLRHLTSSWRTGCAGLWRVSPRGHSSIFPE